MGNNFGTKNSFQLKLIFLKYIINFLDKVVFFRTILLKKAVATSPQRCEVRVNQSASDNLQFRHNSSLVKTLPIFFFWNFLFVSR